MYDEPYSSGRYLQKLQIGLLFDSALQPLWVRNIVHELLQCDVADIRLVINAECRNAGGGICSEEKNFRNSLYRHYVALEKKAFHTGECLLSLNNIFGLLSGIPDVTLGAEDASHLGTDEQIAEISDCDLDLILCFAPIEKRNVCQAAKYGLWLFSFGGDCNKRRNPPCCWEVLEKQPVSILELCVLSNVDKTPYAVKRHAASTKVESIIRNQNNCFDKAWTILYQEMQSVYKERQLFPLYSKCGMPFDNHNTDPTNTEFAMPMLKHLCWLIKEKVFRKPREQWFSAFCFSDIDIDKIASVRYPNVLMPPRDRIWADPFVVAWNDQHYLFMEEMTFASCKGNICVAEIMADGSYTQPHTIIEKPYHLSYPHVFRYNDDFHMLLESSENRSIELYQCKHFPHEWEDEVTLMHDVNAVDSTICCIDGQWWLFTAMDVSGGCEHDQLFAYYAETPYGPWLPHKKNPIVSDARCARPAGRIVHYKNQWLRPAQDCSLGTYGRAVCINRILRLSTTEYEEIEVARIDPMWAKGLTGTHTLNIVDNLIVVDGKHYIDN